MLQNFFAENGRRVGCLMDIINVTLKLQYNKRKLWVLYSNKALS